MNKEQFAGYWKQFRGSARETWGKLTSDDMDQVEGKYEKLVGKLQERYGHSKEQAEKEIQEWCTACDRKRAA